MENSLGGGREREGGRLRGVKGGREIEGREGGRLRGVKGGREGGRERGRGGKEGFKIQMVYLT